ncbi:MAG: hypothetical protein ACK559_26800, partial [bacterium]
MPTGIFDNAVDSFAQRPRFDRIEDERHADRKRCPQDGEPRADANRARPRRTRCLARHRRGTLPRARHVGRCIGRSNAHRLLRRRRERERGRVDAIGGCPRGYRAAG